MWSFSFVELSVLRDKSADEEVTARKKRAVTSDFKAYFVLPYQRGSNP